jgi:hypothetical protein
MTIQEGCQLIAQLKKENESNSEEERMFNEEWIGLLHKAFKEAINKAYPKLKKENVKIWYLSEFPEDELGDEISPSATFTGAQKNLGSIYEYIGVHDSVVRERVFSELSERMGVSYAEIYDQWLNLSNA